MKFVSSIFAELCPRKKQLKVNGANVRVAIFISHFGLERCSIECRNYVVPSRLLSQSLIAVKTDLMSINIVRHFYFP